MLVVRAGFLGHRSWMPCSAAARTSRPGSTRQRRDHAGGGDHPRGRRRQQCGRLHPATQERHRGHRHHRQPQPRRAAAAAAGLRRFVFTGILGSDQAPDVPHFLHKTPAEIYLAEVGVPYVSVRPGAFLDQVMEMTPGHGPGERAGLQHRLVRRPDDLGAIARRRRRAGRRRRRGHGGRGAHRRGVGPRGGNDPAPPSTACAPSNGSPSSAADQPKPGDRPARADALGSVALTARLTATFTTPYDASHGEAGGQR